MKVEPLDFESPTFQTDNQSKDLWSEFEREGEQKLILYTVRPFITADQLAKLMEAESPKFDCSK